MVTDAASDPWPWSALGIEATVDRDAINAAYAARRAALDAQALRISAFAELTEAREKALFLAAELRRDQERSGTTAPKPDPQPLIDNLSPAPRPLEHEPEPEAVVGAGDAGQQREFVGSQEPGYDPVPANDSMESLRLDPDPDAEWSHAGGYIPEAEWQSPDHPTLAFDPDEPLSLSEEWEQFRQLLRNNWHWGFLGLVLLVAMFSGDDEPEEARDEPLVIERPAREILSVQPPGTIDPVQVEAMIDELFGADFDYVGLVSADGAFTPELLKRVSLQPGDFSEARAYLRRRIVGARAAAPREMALATAELHLAWLTTAQEVGDDACREVTTLSFASDTPQMREDWRAFEQSLALGLLQSGSFATQALSVERAATPRWAFDAAAERYDVDVSELRESLGDPEDPNQCSAQIALLQVMLDRRDDVTPAMLASIGGL